ncbi:MAG: carbohydrate kinase family protein [Candidatus Promineifilaceae bacterium]
MKIVVSGSIAFDYLMSFPGKISEQFIEGALENVSLSFLVDSMNRQRGGTAPNIAYTLGLLGGRPTVLGAAGEDFDSYQRWLESKGVDCSGVGIIEGDYCASFFCTTDTVQNQIASFYPGAMAHAGTLTLADMAPDADLVIIAPNDPAAMMALPDECREKGISFIFDPSQQTIRMTGEQLMAGIKGSRLLTSNEYERSLILDKTGLSEEEILSQTGGWLVTLGEKGSLLRVDGKEYHIPVVPAKEIVEPTGAGDAFRAAMMRGMQLGLDWEICGRMGALASTYVLESFGPTNHTYTMAEYVARYREHFDDEGALDALLA